MKEKIYILGDIEMGRKDVTDDFIDDEMVADFINLINHPESDTKVTLILNGDIFDFLKMAYQEKYPRYITEEISLWKLNEVIHHHPLVFEAFKKFVDHPNHFIHFIIGNHDADLIWPALQQRLRQHLGNENRVSFAFDFSTPDIQVEHGDQMDFFFENDRNNPIITYKNQRILNLPWGTYSCFSHWVPLKRKYPEIERLYPKHVALKEHRPFYRESRLKAIDMAIRHIILNPLFRFYDPTYRFPHLRLMQHIWEHGLEFLDDQKFLKTRINMAIKRYGDKKIIALSHSHVLTALETDKQKIFITDTWRDERNFYNLDEQKPKSFIEINSKDNNITESMLKTWQGGPDFDIIPLQTMES